MNSDTTRIMDLPENITMQMNPTHRGDGINTSYSPMDVHPNPYGHPPPSVPSLPTPSSGPTNPQNTTPIYNPPPHSSQPQHTHHSSQEQFNPTIQQSLPSRDIPQNVSSIVQDPEIQQNYIPPVTDEVQQVSDYMKQYDNINNSKIQAHHSQKAKEQALDDWMDKLQLPILVALLFFIFQMPFLDRMIFQRLSFLSIHTTDGNYNTNGMILRSVLFGGLYYLIQYVRTLGIFA